MLGNSTSRSIGPTPCYRPLPRPRRPAPSLCSKVRCRAMISLSARWSLLSRHTVPAARRGLAPSRRGLPPQNLENWAEAAGGEGAAGSRGSGEVAGEGEASAWRSRSTRPLLAWVTKRPAPPSSTVLAAVSGREAAAVAGRRLPYSAPTRPSYGGNRYNVQ